MKNMRLWTGTSLTSAVGQVADPRTRAADVAIAYKAVAWPSTATGRSGVVPGLRIVGAAEDQVGVAAAAGTRKGTERTDGLQGAAAPAFGGAEIADRPAWVEREFQIA